MKKVRPNKMLEFLKDLLEDLKEDDEGIYNYINYHQKVFSLETAIEILEKIKNNKEGD